MSNPSSISVADYRPSPALDAELAELAYASVRGWPDQRPITPALVRSRLRAAGDAPPTSLAFHRDNAGRLKAAAALRWPSRSHAVGRIWGPIVHPTAQRRGLGRALLDELSARTAGVDGRITTAEIPGTRHHGRALFQAAGWAPTGTSSLLRCDLPLAAPAHPRLRFRQPEPGERLDDIVAEQYEHTYPGTHHDTAQETLARWSADERFSPASLTLAEDHQGIAAVALVYPLAHTDPVEPAEALLGDLVVRLGEPTPGLLRRDVGIRALNVAAGHGARVGRIVTGDARLARALVQVGFVLLDTIIYYEADPG